MCANCSDFTSRGMRRRHTVPVRLVQRGFTLAELIAVMLILSVLAAVALPRLQGISGFRDDGWHDQVVAALRLAQKTAVSHRRLVCATVGTSQVTLAIALSNPASACTTSLPGVDGSAAAATANGPATASVSPAGPLYFQPSGRVSTDGAGTAVANRVVSISGQTAITVTAETGHVE
jgi:MSHA pilin protein MshC